MLEPADHLLGLARSSTSVLLTGPEGPDGDSIGACLALQRLLRALVPGLRVDVAGVPAYRYLGLPGAAEMIPDADVGAYDGVIVLDGDRRRLHPPVARAFDAARWTGLIDHHRTTDKSLYTFALFDPEAESTCGMVAALADRWGVPIDATLAALLYAGIVFDTGGFRYSNTKPSTHRLAARLIETGFDHAAVTLRVLVERRPQAVRLSATILSSLEWLAGGRLVIGPCRRAEMDRIGAVEPDLEGVVDVLQHTEGVELAVVAVERPDGRVKLSLRSRGRIDVASLARELQESGGGHAKAAGVVLTGGWDSVMPLVRARLVAAVEG